MAGERTFFFDRPLMTGSAADSVSELDWVFCLLRPLDADCCRWCPLRAEHEWPSLLLVDDGEW